MRRLELFVAAVLGPIPLVLFMLVTSVGVLPLRPVYLVAAFVLAQALFWVTYCRMIEINQLCFASAQPRVAQPYR